MSDYEGYTFKYCPLCDEQSNHRICTQHGVHATVCLECEKKWRLEDALADDD